MTLTSRCPACAGRKKITGLGGMIKDCGECRGVGHVKVVDDKPKSKKDA